MIKYVMYYYMYTQSLQLKNWDTFRWKNWNYFNKIVCVLELEETWEIIYNIKF